MRLHFIVVVTVVFSILVKNAEKVVAVNTEPLRFGDYQKYYYSSDQFQFPTAKMELQMDQFLRLQRAINLRSIKINTPKKLPQALPIIKNSQSQSMIFFDEDDLEPFAPEPIFQIRFEQPNFPIVPRWPPMPSTTTVPPGPVTPKMSKVTFFPTSKPTPQKPTAKPKSKTSSPTTQRVNKMVVNTTKKPKVVVTSSTTTAIPISSSPPPKPDITITETQDKSGESNNEIFLEGGSFYVPFISKQQQNFESKRRNGWTV